MRIWGWTNRWAPKDLRRAVERAWKAWQFHGARTWKKGPEITNTKENIIIRNCSNFGGSTVVRICEVWDGFLVWDGDWLDHKTIPNFTIIRKKFSHFGPQICRILGPRNSQALGWHIQTIQRLNYKWKGARKHLFHGARPGSRRPWIFVWMVRNPLICLLYVISLA
jgi:hypothetical protein